MHLGFFFMANTVDLLSSWLFERRGLGGPDWQLTSSPLLQICPWCFAKDGKEEEDSDPDSDDEEAGLMQGDKSKAENNPASVSTLDGSEQQRY